MHEELVNALRCGTVKGDDKLNCPSCNYYSHGDCCWTLIMLDAADAIERLEMIIEQQYETIAQLEADLEAAYNH